LLFRGASCTEVILNHSEFAQLAKMRWLLWPEDRAWQVSTTMSHQSETFIHIGCPTFVTNLVIKCSWTET
jgi:hypothetical protein